MTRRSRPAPAPAVPPPAAPASSGPAATGAPLGSTGRIHPAIGLGLWGLGRWAPADEAGLRATLDHALRAGIPWVDTAEVYGAGRSERLLGDRLAQAPGGEPRPFLSTKLSWEHLRSSQVRASLIGSLRRLGVPSVDLYLVHAPDPRVPLGETLGALSALRTEGRIAAIGVSNFSLEDLEAVEAECPDVEVVADQVRFNLFEREEADPIRDHCRRRGIVIEAYSPTARGVLAGRFLTGAPPPGDPRRGHGLFAPARWPRVQKASRELADLAAEAHVPLLSLALHAISRTGAAPVFGASHPAQFDEVLAAWSIRPPDRALDRAEAIGRAAAEEEGRPIPGPAPARRRRRG